MAAAADALRDGERDRAVRLLREAWSTDPDNLIIRKQIWAIENPDRFYAGDIDNDWQRRQMRRDI